MSKRKKGIRIAVGSDHAGYKDKQKIIQYLETNGHVVTDVGAFSERPSDYPEYALQVAKSVATKKFDRGILLCGSGTGMAIMANKVKGIRAAAVGSVKTAKLSAEHNWANVLCLSSRYQKLTLLKSMILAWLKTPWARGGRHERRVKKILKFESKLR